MELEASSSVSWIIVELLADWNTIPYLRTQGLGAMLYSPLWALPTYAAVQQIICISKELPWNSGSSKKQEEDILRSFGF